MHMFIAFNLFSVLKSGKRFYVKIRSERSLVLWKKVSQLKKRNLKKKKIHCVNLRKETKQLNRFSFFYLVLLFNFQL